MNITVSTCLRIYSESKTLEGLWDTMKKQLSGIVIRSRLILCEGMLYCQAYWDLNGMARDSMYVSKDVDPTAAARFMRFALLAQKGMADLEVTRPIDITDEQWMEISRSGLINDKPYPWMSEDMIIRSTTSLTNMMLQATTKCEVRDSAISGRLGKNCLGVFARGAMKKNKVFLVDRAAVAAAGPADDGMWRSCTTCFNDLEASAGAMVCCEMQYCSQECSTAALQTFHALLCGRQFEFIAQDRSVRGRRRTRFAMLMARVIACAMAEGSAISHPLMSSLLVPLQGRYEESPFGNCVDLTLLLDWMNRILNEFGGDVWIDKQWDTWVIQTIISRLDQNSYPFPMGSFGKGGVTINLRRCLFNHSCNPNVDLGRVGKTTVAMTALRKIERGEELTVSYGGPDVVDAFYSLRQQFLISHLPNGCKCDRCEEEK